MNPFERGLVGAGDLHAVMSRQDAARESRTVQGRDYRFIYNPMWNHFGDAERKTAGSYYYAAPGHVSYFWNMFDQVLIRPELARQFDPASLKILTSFFEEALIREDGRPDSTQYSDHLPIVFELAFREDGFMAASTDLWGNINSEEFVRTPASILKEQAALLGKKTGNVLEARVETTTLPSGWFGHKLLLVAPTLDNYTYELLKFSHPIQLYPVNPDTFVIDPRIPAIGQTFGPRTVPNEESFVKWLGEKLSSDETHRIIATLLSQSRS